jgi:hypothetical protein
MSSSGMLRPVALVRTDVSEERCEEIPSVRPLLVTASVFPSSPILVTLMKEALSSSETSFLIRATRRKSQKTPFVLCVYVYCHQLRVTNTGLPAVGIMQPAVPLWRAYPWRLRLRLPSNDKNFA